jgi:hypothetical protein
MRSAPHEYSQSVGGWVIGLLAEGTLDAPKNVTSDEGAVFFPLDVERDLSAEQVASWRRERRETKVATGRGWSQPPLTLHTREVAGSIPGAPTFFFGVVARDIRSSRLLRPGPVQVRENQGLQAESLRPLFDLVQVAVRA